MWNQWLELRQQTFKRRNKGEALTWRFRSVAEPVVPVIVAAVVVVLLVVEPVIEELGFVG